MTLRELVVHEIFDEIVKALLTQCNRHPIAASHGRRKREHVATLQSHRLLLKRRWAKRNPPKKEERVDKLPCREQIKRRRKNLWIIEDNACVALKIAANDRDSEEEEEKGGRYTSSAHLSCEVFSNVLTSIPGAHGPSFMKKAATTV